MPHRIPATGVFVAGLMCAVLVAQSPPPASPPPAPSTPQTAQAPQTPVFRAGATLVSVDVYPRRDGRIVEGLTAADFRVFEDGKPQPVETFEFVRVPPKDIEAELRDPRSVSDMEREATNPRNRLFVVYLDIYHTGMFDSQAVRLPLLEFLRRGLGATDLFAVMTPEIPLAALTFARRLDTVEGALSRNLYWGIADVPPIPRTAYEERLYGCSGPDFLWAAREDLFYTSFEQLITRLGGLRDERKNLLLITGWLHAARRGSGGATAPRLPGTGPTGATLPKPGVGRGGTIAIGGAEERAGMADLNWCTSEVARLAAIDYDIRFRDLLTRAQRANVTIYPVDTGGLRVGGGSIDMLRTLAENTGGRAVVDSNDLGAGLRRIAEDQSAFYLIGYRSTNQAADGKYRKIEVKVEQRGVDVNAREGYLGWTEEMRRAEAAALARSRTEAPPSDLALAGLGRFRTDASVHAHVVRWRDEALVVTEIASREIEAGRWKSGAKVTVALIAAGSPPRQAEGVIAPGARSLLLRVPSEGMPAGGWRARVTLQADGVSAEEEVDVASVTTSSVVADLPLVYRGGPAVRIPAVPTAMPFLRRVERLVAEWPVAASLDNRSARVLNVRGEPLPIPVTVVERETDGRRVIAVDLRLTPLAPGDYVLEVTAESGGAAERRLFAFRVTP